MRSNQCGLTELITRHCAENASVLDGSFASSANPFGFPTNEQSNNMIKQKPAWWCSVSFQEIGQLLFCVFKCFFDACSSAVVGVIVVV